MTTALFPLMDEGAQLVWRLTAFMTVFVSLAGLEARYALRRVRSLPRTGRWMSAFGLVTMSSVLTRLVLPLGLIGLAEWAQATQTGLFHVLAVPGWAAFLLALILLDLAVWFQHWATHRITFLWRLHRVHHADPDIDVTTAFRFHPIEIALSALWKGAVVVILGAPALAVFVFEIALNALAQFNHANLALPPRLERALRILIVTPHMHRVHHSVVHAESMRNFGFCLSVWDRLFGQYQREAGAGIEAMVFGQPEWRSAEDQRLDRLVLQPLKPPV